MQALGEGESQALDVLYERHIEKVYNTALHFLTNKEEAEEIAQDVFVELYRSANNFRGEAQVSTLLYRITANKSMDVLRKRNGSRTLKIVFSIFDQPKDEGRHFEHPAMLMEQSELNAEIFKALKKLNARQHQAFVLRYFEDLSQKEISAIMETSEKSIESLLQRAKSQLKIYLSDYRRKN